MNLLEVYKGNYSYVSLKEKGYTIEKFLSETCKYFFSKQLFPKIEKRFLDNKVPNSKAILEKIKNISKVEENTITISPSEITDIINFSIFMERDQMIKENLSKKEFKISKMSDVLVNGIEEEIYENEEKDYSEDQIKKFIIKTSKEITNYVSEKNGNIIITFS
jgi:hypothetical protein